jgi:hypothetical protein
MVTKTFFVALAALAFMSAPALAESSSKSASDIIKSYPRLSSSDEEFLSEMPLEDFPGADDSPRGEDKDGDGIADKMTSMVNPFPDEEEEAKPKVKFVYKPESSMSLRRSINDTRLGDDGYVQSLMQQRGPK